MDVMWFYASGNERKGPVAESQLVELHRSGAVKDDDLVWKDGMAEWVPYKDTPLASLARQTAASTATPGPAILSASPAFSQPQGNNMQVPLAPVPGGISNWMKFNGVMLILQGALSCLGCITIIIGVPLVMAGIALFGSAGVMDQMGGVSPGTLPLFQKLKTFNLCFGIYHIILIAILLVYLVFLIFFFGSMMTLIQHSVSGGMSP